LSDGLVLYCAPGFHRRYRVPLPIVEEVAVGVSFRLRPLLPLLAGDGHFFVLALSQNQVKLYEATRSTIAELPAGSMPASMAEALAHEDPERQLQFRSVGGETAQFHGHGAGGEVDKQTLERFFRAVDRGVVARLGDDPSPLVLAAVAYYAPIYRSISRHPNVIDGCVEGSPECRSPVELHAEAWPLAEPVLAVARQRAFGRLRDAPTARVATALADVLAAAREGRVDTLIVSLGPPMWGHVDPGSGAVAVTDGPSEDLLDRAIADTLLNAGTAFVVDANDLQHSGAAALLRF
jgi:Bacterial archaeo-eukaryotic release factor family 3